MTNAGGRNITVEHGGDGHGDGHHAMHGVEVFMVFAMLLVGAFARFIPEKLGQKVKVLEKLPYTVVLLLIGLLTGFLYGRFACDAPGEGCEENNFLGIAEIDPHVMLSLFLPALLFESAFVMDYHIFWKQFYSIFLLAGPGILLATTLTGFMLLLIPEFSDLREGLGFPLNFLMGTMLSATDPVAVVALLHELGADPKLATLIEGESLMNDGTAIVIFIILKGFTKKSLTGESVVAEAGSVVFQARLIVPQSHPETEF